MCAVETEGGASCWGRSSRGAIGDGTDANRGRPSRVALAGNWTSLDSAYFTCGVHENGHLYCWGATDTPSTLPVAVDAATDWRQVSVSDHACATTTGGRLFCWGDNHNGQLGNGSVEGSDTPVEVSGQRTDWARVAAGELTTCAIRTNGTLWCWGSGGYVGRPDQPKQQPVPVQEATEATTWSQLSSARYHTCALRTDGTIWCWGWNLDADVQPGSGGFFTTPIQLGTDTDWLAVTAGRWRSCAVKTDHTLWCWGGGASALYQVGADTDWTATAITERGACGVKEDDSIWCWGEDPFVIGDESAFRVSPVYVPRP
jgi:alpha-tubulin suppressor-like RCC1 family protein